jgi:hypothetical protein
VHLDRALLEQVAEEAARGGELALHAALGEPALVELRQPAAQRARRDRARILDAARGEVRAQLAQVAAVGAPGGLAESRACQETVDCSGGLHASAIRCSRPFACRLGGPRLAWMVGDGGPRGRCASWCTSSAAPLHGRAERAVARLATKLPRAPCAPPLSVEAASQA